jgi:hypothetical protein
MEHVIDLLRRHGFTDIVVTVAYQANAIENYFGNGAEFGASIAYASEEPPWGRRARSATPCASSTSRSSSFPGTCSRISTSARCWISIIGQKLWPR